MKKDIKLYEATITNDDVKKIIRELKNSIKEHKKEKHSISAGMGMTWEEWDIFFEYFDNLQQENERLKRKLTTKKLFKKHKVQTPENFEIRKIFELQQRIEKAINKIQYIRDIGFDYDGFNNTKDLKKLIDELVDIAGQSIDILNGRSDE